MLQSVRVLLIHLDCVIPLHSNLMYFLPTTFRQTPIHLSILSLPNLCSLICLSFPLALLFMLIIIVKSKRWIVRITTICCLNTSWWAIRVIALCDSDVGKSCLLSRYVDSHFKEDHEPTLGVEFASKIIELEAQIIKTQIWDTVASLWFRPARNPLRPSLDHITKDPSLPS